MQSREIISVSFRLFIITAVTTLCLALVNSMTAGVIKANAEKAQHEAQKEVLPAALEFKKTEASEKNIPEGTKNGVRIESLNVGIANGNGVGYIATMISNAGYGGDIKVMVGIDSDGSVTKVKILQSSETAGLGQNASKPEFINQFNGKSGSLSVVKNKAADGENGEIAAISGATVTSRAVTSCVNAALELVGSKSEQGMDASAAAAVDEKVKQVEEETNKQLNGEGANGQ